jgi:hypothetical protein
MCDQIKRNGMKCERLGYCWQHARMRQRKPVTKFASELGRPPKRNWRLSLAGIAGALAIGITGNLLSGSIKDFAQQYFHAESNSAVVSVPPATQPVLAPMPSAPSPEAVVRVKAKSSAGNGTTSVSPPSSAATLTAPVQSAYSFPVSSPPTTFTGLPVSDLMSKVLTGDTTHVPLIDPTLATTLPAWATKGVNNVDALLVSSSTQSFQSQLAAQMADMQKTYGSTDDKPIKFSDITTSGAGQTLQLQTTGTSSGLLGITTWQGSSLNGATANPIVLPTSLQPTQSQ